VIYTSLRGRLEWSWIKNAPDAAALLRRHYPRFVFDDVDELGGVVPVFTFHSARPETFEADCRFLAEAGYRTLSPDEFADVIEGRIAAPRRAVLLSFDDGTGSVWAVVHPLLRKYGLCATSFVISEMVSDDETRRPNLEDVWAGRSRLEAVTGREREAPACSWTELREMQAAGTVHVQSHSARHALVHTGPKIRDFLNPSTDPCFMGNMNLPLVRADGIDRADRPLVLGRPVYQARPLLEGRPRYLDDEALRRRCEEYVAAGGGESFFRRRGWRRELRAVAERFRREHGDRGRFEGDAERRAALERELGGSRETIEAGIGAPVRHLGYPWYVGCDESIEISKHVGYRTNFWGILPAHREVRAGHDLHRIPRVDARYLTRLPGPGRRPLREILSDHLLPRLRALATG
jgi:hypothetical protein